MNRRTLLTSLLGLSSASLLGAIPLLTQGDRALEIMPNYVKFNDDEGRFCMFAIQNNQLIFSRTDLPDNYIVIMENWEKNLGFNYDNFCTAFDTFFKGMNDHEDEYPYYMWMDVRNKLGLNPDRREDYV